MSVRLYWSYHYNDERLEDAISQDPEEVRTVWGLTEEQNVSVSDMSRFLTERYDEIYEEMICALAGRCWRFSHAYAEFQAEEFTDPTLVVRKWMLGVQLPADIKKQADAIVASCAGDKWKLVNSLDSASERLVDKGDYSTRLAWDIYRYRAYEECQGLDVLILPVEEYLEEAYWMTAWKRVKGARAVSVKRVNSNEFVAKGSSAEYLANTRRVKCTCPDFINKGMKNGMHCKHLIAALREDGLWDKYWGCEMPAA